MPTFTELKTEIKDRLSLTSTEADTRVGRILNQKYKEVTTSVGLVTTRRTTVSTLATTGQSTLTFTGIEKIINVVDRRDTNYKIIPEADIEELKEDQVFTLTFPSKYAVQSTTYTTVTILMNCVPVVASPFTLYADGWANMATLSGSNVPVFAESFHDILVWGVLADEYRRIMKLDLALDAEKKYEKRLSELRLFIASSAYLDIYQGKHTKNEAGVKIS